MTIKILAILFLTILSGWSDSQGFLHADNIWKRSQIVFPELIKSALGFAFGVIAYWITLKVLSEIKTVSVEIQTLGWFGITIIGVALTSGNFLKWQLMDQLVALLVFVGIFWLLFHTGG